MPFQDRGYILVFSVVDKIDKVVSKREFAFFLILYLESELAWVEIVLRFFQLSHCLQLSFMISLHEQGSFEFFEHPRVTERENFEVGNIVVDFLIDRPQRRNVKPKLLGEELLIAAEVEPFEYPELFKYTKTFVESASG